jgi:two-component sensor histidine kinase
MAATYALVSREQWGEVPLSDIFATALEPHVSDGDGRLTIEGPPAAVRPSGALALGLIAHELATNAVKYSALSNDHGQLSVTWQPAERGRRLVIRWREPTGPRVSRCRRARRDSAPS